MIRSPIPQDTDSGVGPWMDLFIEDLTLDMSIGVHDREKTALQKVMVSLTARTSLPAPGQDELGGVVSYSDIVRGIRGLAGQGHINLVETFAERIAALCLDDPRIHSVTVRVTKPEAYTDARGVGVILHRTQYQTGNHERL